MVNVLNVAGMLKQFERFPGFQMFYRHGECFECSRHVETVRTFYRLSKCFIDKMNVLNVAGMLKQFERFTGFQMFYRHGKCFECCRHVETV